MDRYVCIHGHFYQPPRENPWLEAIELQDSAYPYHDWNERITAECYAPNAALAHPRRRGPHRRRSSTTTRASASTSGRRCCPGSRRRRPTSTPPILEADRESRERFSGHGSAIAQAYNHMILPLANAPRQGARRCVWGIRDFEHRFGRRPEGMWLPETAVDLATLEVARRAGHPLHDPRAAPGRARARDRASATGSELHAGQHRPDARLPRARCRPGAAIAVFFYDGPISRAVAFEGLLVAAASASRTACSAASPTARDVAAARPHRHRRRDLRPPPPPRRHGARLRARRTSRRTRLARLTNYGEFLERHPPTARGRDRREHVLELRPRRRALARATAAATRAAARLEPGLARAAARGARLAARRAGPALRGSAAGSCFARPLGRARRLHRRHPRPLAGTPRALPRSATPRGRSTPAERDRAR